VVEEVPTELAVAGEDGTGQSAQPGLEVVLGWGWFGCGCGELVQNRRFGGLRCDLGLRGGKMGEHAVAHLGGGFFGEGDGEDLLRLLYGVVGEQPEQALDEQAGLAGAGRGLDDEGAADIKSLLAGIGVVRRGEWLEGKRRSSATGGLRACGIERAVRCVGDEIFVQRVGVERGGIEAAEQALLAVLTGLRVLLGLTRPRRNGSLRRAR